MTPSLLLAVLASGFIYGVRLLQLLAELRIESHLVISRAALLTMAHETDYKLADVTALASHYHRSDDVAAGIASGSFRCLGMVVAPCSMRTLGEIATGTSSSLISRAADVTLKERRTLVLMARETPLTLAHLRNMTAVTEMGGIIAPPVPAFYARPENLAQMIDHSLGRVLDLFGLDSGTALRWGEPLPHTPCGSEPAREEVMTDNTFSEAEREAVYRAIAERRDMRHFTGGTVEPDLLRRLLEAAHQAPSVGLMQPWRFIRISDRALRGQIQNLVEAERIRTAEALGERSDEFMKLKVEGINDCAEVLVAALMDDREKHIFGRRTLPEMDMASLSCAIQNLWLASRAEGLGMGWVSLFEPQALADLLQLPAGAKPLAVLCLGPVKEFYPAPMLVLEGWAQARPLNELLYENYWGVSQ